MNKLRDKFIGQTRVFSEERGWQDDLESAIECEQITDDFSVKFAEWCYENYSFKKQDYYELLQIFKTQYYGKV